MTDTKIDPKSGPFDTVAFQKFPASQNDCSRKRKRIYKIIETDNFGGDYPNEKFLNVPLTNQENAIAIAESINVAFSGLDLPRYWRVVKEDYKLAPGFEP